MLFDPSHHEPLTERPWDEDRVRAAIATVVADAEAAFDDDDLWSPHPVDEVDGPLPQVASLYLGASGVIWALHQLERRGAAGLTRDWAPVAVSMADRYLAHPDFPELTDGAPVPSLLMGEAGTLLVAHTLAPARWQEERLLAAVRANATSPARELSGDRPARCSRRRSSTSEPATSTGSRPGKPPPTCCGRNGAATSGPRTGDPGAALYLQDCIAATTAFPTLDFF
jgi:hypothetical protein